MGRGEEEGGGTSHVRQGPRWTSGGGSGTSRRAGGQGAFPAPRAVCGGWGWGVG